MANGDCIYLLSRCFCNSSVVDTDRLSVNDQEIDNVYVSDVQFLAGHSWNK
jgi:hypothetical protein